MASAMIQSSASSTSENFVRGRTLYTETTETTVTLDDIDDLIGALSPEELKELSSVDPDDSSLPPSMRCLYNCEKNITGEVDRDKMLTHLKEEAVAIPDKEERVEFVPGTIRGKQYVPKDDIIEIKPKGEYDSDEDDVVPVVIDVSYDAEREKDFKEISENATLDDIKEIADILGVAYQDHCYATELKIFPEEAPNTTDITEVLKQVEGNGSDCIEINLNNIQGIDQETWLKFFAALARNTTVEGLTASNCDLTDTVANAIADCLEQNRCLKFLTLDSNNIGGDMLVKIIKATAVQKILEELRCSNQVLCFYFILLSSMVQSKKEIFLPSF